MLPIWLIPACFGAALTYSSVGLAGGSTYLALLAAAGIPHEQVRVTALLLNLVVAGIGVWRFARAGHLRTALLVPFAVASVPASFLAAQMPLSERVFYGLLAASLAATALRVLLVRESSLRPRDLPWNRAWLLGPLIGFGLGLLAGLTGIGGGIFLGPILILAGWADGRRAAAAASGFILLNSLSGLSSHLLRGNLPDAGLAVPLAAAVLAGGFFGSRFGALRLSPATVRRGLGLVVLLIAVKLAWSLP